MSTVPTLKAQVRVHIRWMIRRDMPEVLAIEHASFEYPWCEEEFLRVLRQRNCIGMVAEHEDRVVGFMIYELHKTKLHVLNFAVAPGWRLALAGRPSAAHVARFLQHPVFADVPMLLEVPGFDKKGPDRANVDRLRQLAGRDPLPEC